MLTAPRSCLKVLTQEDSLKYSYYSSDGFEPLSYRVDFSTQTVYYHDLTVQLLRGPNNEKETKVKPHSINMQQDPWKVTVSNVSNDNDSTSKKDRKGQINRWGRETRERVWLQFCHEIKFEEQQRLYKELQLAEKDLNDIVDVGADSDEFEEQSRQLEETLDAMEEIW